MSTDRSRLVSSIRRIVLTDPDLSSALDAWQNRGDQASSTGTGTSDAERDRLCCDGSTSDNPNPGADTRDTSEGGQDGLNDDDPALLDSGPGSLTGVTDCATGEPICFDGNDWLPPEGWDGPTDPPPNPYYEEGRYWSPEATDYDTGLGLTPLSAFQDGAPDGVNVISVEVLSFIELDAQGHERYSVEYTRERLSDGDISTFTSGATWYFCGLAGADETACGEEFQSDLPEDAFESAWPEDGCTNLAIKSGAIVGSKYDPENDGTYSKPMSEIELCDEFGNSFFLSPASTGLFKTIDATKTDGYLYDNNGKKIAHIDGKEYSDPDI